MNKYELNIIPFNILTPNVKICFSDKSEFGYYKIYKDQLPKDYPVNNALDNYWWKKPDSNGDTTHQVNLIENKRFANVYFSFLIFNHFKKNDFVIDLNFVKDIRVWVKDGNPNNGFQRYMKYCLHLDNNELYKGNCIRLSYDGISLLSVVPLSELQDINLDDITRVKHGNSIVKYKDLNETQKSDTTKIYPFVNFYLWKYFGLKRDAPLSNKYKIYRGNIHSFYEKNLKGKEIDGTIKIYSSGFYNITEDKMCETPENSNLMLFGNNKTHYNAYYGIKEFGPLSKPENNNIKFIFVFKNTDKDYANKLFSYLSKGYKSFPGLKPFIGISCSLDIKKSIIITTENVVSEIDHHLSINDFEENIQYIALYITDIKKDEQDEEKLSLYYKIKKLLLSKNITSQVIYRENIENPNFNYFLPNISIAILAKLGGIPWRLYRPIENDLIVGIGAYRRKDVFIGNSFCFNNSGKFEGFNAYKNQDMNSLAESIKDSIISYIRENKNISRLIIHYYKTLNQENAKILNNLIYKLNLDITFVIVTISDTESKEYICFDTDYDGLMLKSGSFFMIKRNQYLLYNNTRYKAITGAKIDGFPFPIKIKIDSNDSDYIKNENIVHELIDQVYQFSRMYWKSVKQRNKPVTIEYSEIIAEMMYHFEDNNLPDFAKKTLWFL